MKRTASDEFMDTLVDWGVEVIFGLPGDGIDGFMEALRIRQDKIRFIHVRHEEAAAFMACAYAKYTGKLGVCIATSGPGGIHLLNGLYDAKLDKQPVLAITGLQFHDLLNTHTQQDVELDRLFEDVCVYNARVMGPSHTRNVANLACRAAIGYRGVSHVTMPVDIQSEPMGNSHRSKRNVPEHESDHFAGCARLPDEKSVQMAARILNEGKKIAILAGQGALDATDELIKTSEMLGAPIIKALLGKGAVPDDCPYTTGQIGLVGTRPSQEAFESCDTLLIVGSCMPYIEFYPKPGQVRVVQIDIDSERIGIRSPADAGLVGDSKRTLQVLLPLLKQNKNTSFLQQAQNGMKQWWAMMEKRGTDPSLPMKPQVVAWELGKRLSDTAIVSCDSGTAATWWARQIPVKRGQKHSVSGTLASMACGLPYAIAAQVAYPDRQSIAFVGDGAFSMLMADFSTCIKYNLPVKVVVLKNNVLAQIKWEQIVLLGNPEFGCALEPIDFAGFARNCGANGFTITEPAQCGPILDEALNTPGPAIIEAVVDPNEPPLPPKIEFSQAKHFAEALLRGTPYRGKIVMTVAADKVRDLT
jgi:pyruvate dehydrogenase (quinone)/pyruvate oxidase